MKLLICDIDGTIADFRRREKRAGAMPPRDKLDLFQTWLDKLQSPQHLKADKPIKHVLFVIRSLLNENVNVIYLTGRSEKYRKATNKWLKKNKAPILPLFMRGNDDWRPAKEYKKDVILQLMRDYEVKACDILTIDDDGDGDCSAMYRSLGILHLKVCL